MVTFEQVKAARHGSNYAEVLEAYLEPANLYQVMNEHHDLMEEIEEGHLLLLEQEEKERAAAAGAGSSENVAETNAATEKPHPQETGV